MRKHENKTFGYLKALLPQVTIDREFPVHEPIYHDGKLVKHFILIDFRFVLNGQEFFVEFQGTQHYKAVRKFGGKKALEIQKIRDSWLRGYCKGRGITLIELDGRVLRHKKIKVYLESVLPPVKQQVVS
jgi:uncharacterized protein (DUF39 family)